MTYRRYTEEERAAWLAKFERTTVSAAAFCREHGISYGSFMRWRGNAAPGPGPEPGAIEPAEFIELEIPRPPSEAPPVPCAQSVEIDFPCGLTLRIAPAPAPRP